MNFTLSPEIVVLTVAGLLAVLLDWFPGLAVKFDALPKDQKRLLVLALCFLLVLLVVLGQCYLGWFQSNLVCSAMELAKFLYYLFLAVGTSYGIHASTKPTARMKQRLGMVV